MQKIILYYMFSPLKDPLAIQLWQKKLALSLNLRGRIIVAQQGINGTLGGDIKDIKAYIKETKTYPGFKAIEFKWSDGNNDDFPKLSVKLKPELVSFGRPDQVKVNSDGVVGIGKKIKPQQLHQLLQDKGKEVVFIDGRNAREAAIGKFKDAIVMDVQYTRDFPKAISSSKYQNIKDKTVITYCTGGIRCEVLSKLMLDEGYKNVYQLDGGIVKYIEEFGDTGFWEGSLFVFDKRMATKSSDNTKTIGHCVHCQATTDNYENCRNLSCNELILICSDCLSKTATCLVCSLTTNLN
jgi:UPF0176 protein